MKFQIGTKLFKDSPPTIKHLTQNLAWQITFKVNFLFLALNAYIGFVEEVMIPCRILALMAQSRPVIFELIPG